MLHRFPALIRVFRIAAILHTSLSLAALDGDPRNIVNGLALPSEGYADQPYIVVTSTGHWLCVLTTGHGEEGHSAQHIVSTRSADQGRTWSPLVDIEPADGPEASWAVPLLTPSGRVYVFYTYNGDRISELRGRRIRADMLGWYCFKYSDDSGLTWSQDRHRLPVRLTACDRANDWQGQVQIFWGIDKPKVSNGVVGFGFTKLGRYLLDDGEGWFFRSDNLLHEPDPSRLRWEMVPTGDHGLRHPRFGSVQEEFNTVPLGGDRWFCIYRTTHGYPCEAYSDDGGRSWTEPRPARYTPGGRLIRNPRACPRLFPISTNQFLLWFHHHGGKTFADRNPAWIAGGTLQDGRIHWSQPEIILYADDPATRMSYPDLVQDGGQFWISETQKSVARVHPLDPSLIASLLIDPMEPVAPEPAALTVLTGTPSARVEVPPWPLLQAGPGPSPGFTFECWLRLNDRLPGAVLFDTRLPSGAGILLRTTARASVELLLSDGTTTATWETDPGLLTLGRPHQVAFIIDAGPRLITTVVDGQVGDGGGERTFGWTRFPRELLDVNGRADGSWPSVASVELLSLRAWLRPLRHHEIISSYRAGQATFP